MNSVPELDATSSNHGLLLENIRKVEGDYLSVAYKIEFRGISMS